MMVDDARFEDGREHPLNLGAEDADDLKVLSALAQDAVFPVTEMRWDRARRRFALLLNRFRWEDQGRARHGAERVQSLLVVENVTHVASQGIDRADKDLICALLALDYTGDEVGETLTLTLAGDGAIRLDLDGLDVTLKDVTKPYKAPSGQVPDHDL